MIAHKIIRDQKGIGLIEVVAALGISVLVLTSLVSLSLYTMRQSLASKLQLEGTKLANKQIELVRAYRDRSAAWYVDGTTPSGFLQDIAGCYDDALEELNGTLEADTGCHISDSLSLEAFPDEINESTAEAIKVRFFATNTSNGGQLSTDPVDEEVRIHVVVSWKVGDDDRFARLYTDLTNWRN